MLLYQEDWPTNPDIFLLAAKAMRGKLRSRLLEDQTATSLSQLTIAEFKEAGFFKILQPRSMGGWEQPASSLFRLEIALAEANMSAAWVVANMAVAGFHVALFGQAAQYDVWETNPDAIISTANMPGGRLTPQSDGTLVLNGHWRFSSGVDHADWIILGSIIEQDTAPIAGACLVPRSAVEIIPDWDVIGLRGTGSNAIQVKDAIVPQHRFLAHIDRFHLRAPGLKLNNSPLYRLPLPQLLFRAISGASIGGLSGMLSSFIDSNRSRTSMMSQKIAEDPQIQALCGEVHADLMSMEEELVRDLDNMMKRECSGDSADLAMRRRSRLNTTRVSDHCFMRATSIFRAAGASALYRDSILLQFYNDMLAARQHAANQYEVHARNDGSVLFGEEMEDMLL